MQATEGAEKGKKRRKRIFTLQHIACHSTHTHEMIEHSVFTYCVFLLLSPTYSTYISTLEAKYIKAKGWEKLLSLYSTAAEHTYIHLPCTNPI